MDAKPQIDPYYLWLGIPPAEQPPNHYRLLGVTLFEANAEVIDAAAFRRNKQLRAYALGPHSDCSQRLLNEVAAAKICLSRPEKKSAYDAELRARLTSLKDVTAPAGSRVKPVTPVEAAAKPTTAIEPAPPIQVKPAARAINTRKTTFDIEPLAPPANLHLPRGPLSASPRLPTLRRHPNRATRAKPVAWQWFAVGGGTVAALMLGLALFRAFGPSEESAAKVVSLNQRDRIPAFQPRGPMPLAAESSTSTPAFSAPTPPGAPLPFAMTPAATPPAAPWLAPALAGPPPAIAPFSGDQARRHQQAWAAHLGVPVEYKNTIGMKFVLIPPGEFLMGSTAAQVQAEIPFALGSESRETNIRSEAPQHKVILTQPFYLGAHEVTRKHYEAVMGKDKLFVGLTRPALHPVEGLKWDDAIDFCEKLTELETIDSLSSQDRAPESPSEGIGYRLPTEAEWEFACRAGTTSRFWIGDQDEQLYQAAWFDSSGAVRTHAVGELKANPFGLYDTHGNVSEWVQDFWEPNYYRQFDGKPAIDPIGPSSGSDRVVRGGLCHSFAIDCRASRREPKELSTRHSAVGFRVALAVQAVRAAIAGGKSKPARATASSHEWPANAPPPAIAPFSADQARQHQQAWAGRLGVPMEHVNSIGMQFVLIPPGEFQMGSTPAEVDAALVALGSNDLQPHLRAECPQHKVTLTQSVYLGVFEVTQAQYEQVMGKNPSHFAATGAGKKTVVGLDTSTHPVEMVSWQDAADFCEKLSKNENLKPFKVQRRASETAASDDTGYRLPTEAEWEFACRAGTTTRFWIGDRDEQLGQAAWFRSNARDRTHAVGELKSNPFGLYDIHGNVCEWVQDCYDRDSYTEFRDEPAIDPSNVSYPGIARVVRGGAWIGPSPLCRAPCREGAGPTSRHQLFGFRVALTIAGSHEDR